MDRPKSTLDGAGKRGATVIKNIAFKRSQYVVVNIQDKRSLSPAEIKTQQLNLQQQFGAESVTPDFYIGLGDASSDPVAADDKAWHVEQLNYDKLPENFSGQEIIVAVLDTGVDITHPALKDQIWVNTKEIAANNIDDDGNGFIDDVNGWNANKKNGDIKDTMGHGTHCAGIIGSKPKAETPFSPRGVAPSVKLMPVHIIQGDAKSFMSDAADGIKYAVDNGAKILSNSWRLYQSWTSYEVNEANVKLLREAIEYAGASDVLFVVAAGNESRNVNETHAKDPIYPVGFNDLGNLISVAATNSKKEIANFSNYGHNYVHVAAPGDSIISTLNGGSWGPMSGTSMATPLVAGALARGLSGGMEPLDSFHTLSKTSDQVAGWTDKVKSQGIINLQKFLQ